MLSQLQYVYHVIFMHITTFGRSLVVLRALFIVQPQTAWMPAELQTAMDGWKPVKKEKLFEVLDRAAEKLSKNEKVIDIELAGELIRVPVYRIRYADMLENYVTIHAAQDYTFKMMLGDLQNELDDGTEILLPQV